MINQQIRKYLILIIAIFSTSPGISQCINGPVNFLVGERIDYKVYYNWGFIWVDAGTAYFRVDTARYGNEPVYHFISQGKSLPKHDWFFKVNDKYQSYASLQNLEPRYFTRDVYEGGFKAVEYYHFNHSKKKVFIDAKNSKTGAKKDSVAIPNCIWDVMTAIYVVRSIDYSTLKAGQKVPVNMIIDGEVFTNLYIKLIDRVKAKDDAGNTYRCLKFSAMLVEGTIFQGGEDVFVYVTDDQNKIPVCIEAKILVGSVKVFLTKYIKLKYPVTSLIEKAKTK